MSNTRMIKLTLSQKVVTEVEVTFPVYSETDEIFEASRVSSCTRWDLSGWRLTIKHHHGYGFYNQGSYVIEKSYFNPAQTENIDYVTGKGEYESSAQEFEDMYAAALSFLQSFPITEVGNG